jgi:hypothetical protein
MVGYFSSGQQSSPGISFVPTLSGASGAPDSYLQRVGRFTRAGSLVLASYGVQLATKGTLTGALTLNLPVPANAVAVGNAIMMAGPGTGFLFDAPNSYALAGVFGANNPGSCTLYQMGSSGAFSALTAANLSNSGQGFFFSLVYEAA